MICFLHPRNSWTSFSVFSKLFRSMMCSLSTVCGNMFPRSQCFTDDILLDFTLTLFSFYSLFIIIAVSLAGILPPVWEKWCQAHSSQTPTLQVGPTDTSLFRRGDTVIQLTEGICLICSLFVSVVFIQLLWYC